MLKRKITVTFYDSHFMTKEEAQNTIPNMLGTNCTVEVDPAEKTPQAMLELALADIITLPQLSAYYSTEEPQYLQELEELKSKVLAEVEHLYYKIVGENEARLQE